MTSIKNFAAEVFDSSFRLAPIDKTRLHEETIEEDIESLRSDMEKSGFYRVPIIGAVYKDRNDDKDLIMVVDGHHRKEAAEILKLVRIPFINVDYIGEGVDLDTWKRSFPVTYDLDEFRRRINNLDEFLRDMEIPGITIRERGEVSRDEIFEERVYKDEPVQTVSHDFTTDHFLIIYNNIAFIPNYNNENASILEKYAYIKALEETLGLEETYETVWGRDENDRDIRLGTNKCFVNTDDASEAFNDVSLPEAEGRVLIIPPKIRKIDVMHVSAEKQRFPQKSTRHEATGIYRLFGFKIPLDLLRDGVEEKDALKEIKNEMLKNVEDDTLVYHNGFTLERPYSGRGIVFNYSDFRDHIDEFYTRRDLGVIK